MATSTPSVIQKESLSSYLNERPEDRPLDSGFRGIGLLIWYSFWKALTNPFSIAFSILLPIFMYSIFGMGTTYADNWIVHANVAATILVNMTLYGSITTTSAAGAVVALERTSGVSRLYALTPLSNSAIIIARVVSSLLISAVVITVTYLYGGLTGARMEASSWLLSALLMIGLSILPACIGLASAFSVRSDASFAMSSALIVLSSFAAGMFMPLEQMGKFFQVIAPYSPLYGLTNLVQLPLYGWDQFQWSFLFNYLAWTLIFAGIAIFFQKRDTGR